VPPRGRRSRALAAFRASSRRRAGEFVCPARGDRQGRLRFGSGGNWSARRTVISRLPTSDWKYSVSASLGWIRPKGRHHGSRRWKNHTYAFGFASSSISTSVDVVAATEPTGTADLFSKPGRSCTLSSAVRSHAAARLLRLLANIIEVPGRASSTKGGRPSQPVSSAALAAGLSADWPHAISAARRQPSTR